MKYSLIATAFAASALFTGVLAFLTITAVFSWPLWVAAVLAAVGGLLSGVVHAQMQYENLEHFNLFPLRDLLIKIKELDPTAVGYTAFFFAAIAVGLGIGLTTLVPFTLPIVFGIAIMIAHQIPFIPAQYNLIKKIKPWLDRIILAPFRLFYAPGFTPGGGNQENRVVSNSTRVMAANLGPFGVSEEDTEMHEIPPSNTSEIQSTVVADDISSEESSALLQVRESGLNI